MSAYPPTARAVTTWLASVATLALVMAATPGPNNVLFAASGARVGYLRSLPALFGMLVGFSCVIGASALGIGSLMKTYPDLKVSLQVAASGYMLWIALRLWRSAGNSRTPPVDRPAVKWWHLTALQLANPKTWLASLAFVSGFLGPNAPGGVLTDALGIAWFLTVVAISASVWVVFGAGLRTGLGAGRWSTVNRALGVLAAATVVTFWI